MRETVWRTVQVDIDNVSYVGVKFWNVNGTNGAMSLNLPAWIGVGQMMVMVVSPYQSIVISDIKVNRCFQCSSMICVFVLGFRCYLHLSSQLSVASSSNTQLQKQLFYALVVQTAIPLFLMHIPITVYFGCPMLNIDFDYASEFMVDMITIYPAIDPLPNFFIIKNYRNAIVGKI